MLARERWQTFENLEKKPTIFNEHLRYHIRISEYFLKLSFRQYFPETLHFFYINNNNVKIQRRRMIIIKILINDFANFRGYIALKNLNMKLHVYCLHVSALYYLVDLKSS